MDRELLEHYNTELALLYDYAKEFSEEYPGIAERLGGLTRERGDPMTIGLLEGVALLAARVQLKLKHEFPEFTHNLIEQLLPHYLAPIPSAMLIKIQPTFGDSALREGRIVKAGALLDASYKDKDRDIACCFTLSNPITYWPFELTQARYIPALGPLQALRLDCGPGVAAGLHLHLTLRTAARLEDEGGGDVRSEDPGQQVSGCKMSDLPIYLVGAEADAIALYEQIFAQCNGVLIRYMDDFGDPQVVKLGLDCLEQLGFDENETLFPSDQRMFQGFTDLQDYFVFPRKYLGFRIKGLGPALSGISAKAFDIILTFNHSLPALAHGTKPDMFALYAGIAVNLFKKTTDRIQVKANRHEYQVVPDRSQPLRYEPHRILDVFLHHPGQADKVPVRPLHEAGGGLAQAAACYAMRRLPRRRSSDERRFGMAGDYIGTDMYIALTPPDPGGWEISDRGHPELSLNVLCSNRHLAQHLPVGKAGSDFRLRDDATLAVQAVIPPTPPREAPIMLKHESVLHPGIGPMAWRLIHLLSLNHLGLTAQDGGALREILSSFADLGDSATDRKIRGLCAIESRAVVRRLQQRGGVGVARGVEITVTFEDKAFEGSGVFLLGAVLDRFFSEYVAINHFTQTIIKTVERGVIARWPARSGSRGAL